MAYRVDADEDLGVCLVTGGAGWLGSHLVQQLLSLGGSGGMGCPQVVGHVHICDVAPAEVPAATGRVTSHVLDLRDAAAVRALVMATRPRVIFHLASVVDVRPFREEAVFDINVGGTVNLAVAASACHECRAFVYCSTLDVVYCGRAMDRVEETLAYSEAARFPCWLPTSAYPASKARAEEVVLAADASGTAGRGAGLRTCALRPGHLFGERDALVDMFSRLPVSISGPPCRMTMQYIGNAAALHVLAARRLLRERASGDEGIGFRPAATGGGNGKLLEQWVAKAAQSEVLSGRAVNIGDFEEVFAEFYGRQLQPGIPGHRPPLLLPVPVPVLFGLGLALDLLDFLFILLAMVLTPFAVLLGFAPRSRALKWRLPRHPALCLASTTALESTTAHTTDRGLGERLFGHTELYAAAFNAHDPAVLCASGGVGLVPREESTRRTRAWIEGRLTKVPGVAKATGYSFKG